VGAKAGQRGRSAGRQRLALIIFGALFVLLFAGFAVTQGLTGPSVPSGDVAHVSDAPSEFANIGKEKLERSTARQAGEGKPLPKPGTEKYEELQTKALTEVIEGVWIRGEAEDLGITVTDKQVEDELATIKKQNFPTKAAYDKFLEKSNFTQDEVDDLVKLQLLSQQIQEIVSSQGPPPSDDQIEAYYEAEKETQFTTQESRDVRTVINKDKAKVEAAKDLLEKDSSPESWKEAASKYSIDPTSKAKGGLQKGITEEFVKGPLKEAIFGSATGELVGPVKFQANYILVEVVKLNPEKVQTLEEAKPQISSTLGQEGQQEFFSEFVADFRAKWQSRTVCAEDYLIELCSNYVGNGHPTNAPAACFEADPETPATQCPALVTPTSPALPGSVSPTKPKGEPFPQRPLPEASAEPGKNAPTEVPPGAAPPGE
jgi:parvulin-like peptidyl-prolyl isomerase